LTDLKVVIGTVPYQIDESPRFFSKGCGKLTNDLRGKT
jgi:hypothetical protein